MATYFMVTFCFYAKMRKTLFTGNNRVEKYASVYKLQPKQTKNAISLVFLGYLRRKIAVLGAAYPLVLIYHLYVFGISGTRRMGKHTEIISKSTFDFFQPPYYVKQNCL